MTAVDLHVVVPGPLEQRTGGYLYDARMVTGLGRLGWTVTVHNLEGRFPDGDDLARSELSGALESIPGGSRVIVDGLAMGGMPEPIREHASRLRIIGLVHHPLADETGISPQDRLRFTASERAALAQCEGVIVTSGYTAHRLAEYGVSEDRIRAVPPGTEPAEAARGPGAGAPPCLVCVATVTPRKGHEVLVEALASIADLPWTCVCAGSLDRDPEHTALVLRRVEEAGLSDRVAFVGERDGVALEEVYAEASIFVLASYYEGYGMALAEALARGLPVVSTTGGAIPFTVPDSAGILVRPGDSTAFAGALRQLLEEGRAGSGKSAGPADSGTPTASTKRSALAEGAHQHARELPDWPQAVEAFAEAILELTPIDPPVRAVETFEASWLALREPVDQRSRAESLIPALVDWWRSHDGTRILDLGSGTGSNLRYLAPRLGGAQEWTLVDHDAGLLAVVELPDPAPTVETVQGDLDGAGLAEVAHADLVTASALLDLVSETWLDRLVTACSSAGAAALFALTYDGLIEWADPDPDDPLVRDAVNAHQLRDKGSGPALGPAAAARAREAFEAAGYRTWLVPSPWRLGPDDARLAEELVMGWMEAASEQAPPEAKRIVAWARRRREALSRPDLALEVGHLDLLALPPDEERGRP